MKVMNLLSVMAAAMTMVGATTAKAETTLTIATVNNPGTDPMMDHSIGYIERN
jgi:hypothetical protein